jgi:hypothetical protein
MRDIKFHKDFKSLDCFHYTLWAFVLTLSLFPFFMTLNGEQKAMLSFAGEITQHGSLYSRVFDMNLPLIFYIQTLPLGLSKILPLSPKFLFHIYNIILCITGYLVLQFSLKKSKITPEEQRYIRDIYACIIVIIPSITLDWGQREHLLFVFSLPWIIQIIWQQKPTPISTVLATLGFCLRPYNAVIPLFMIASVFIKTKNRNETFQKTGAALIAILYSIYIAIIFIIFQQYINSILYTTIKSYYYLYQGKSHSTVIPFFVINSLIFYFYTSKSNINLIAFFVSCYILALLNIFWNYSYAIIITPLLLTLFFSLRNFFIKEDNFYYKGLFYIFIIILFYLFFEKIEDKNFLFIFLLSFCFISFCLFNKFFYIITPQLKHIFAFFALLVVCRLVFLNTYSHSTAVQRFSDSQLSEEIIKNSGERFVLLSVTSWGSKYVQLGKTHHTYAFDWLWPLPWVYHHQQNPAAKKIRSIMADHLTRALQEEPPPTLIIDRSPEMRRIPSIRFEDFLSEDNDRLKKILGTYHHSKFIDFCSDEKVAQNNLPEFRDSKNPNPFINMCKVEIFERKGVANDKNENTLLDAHLEK